ncbi:hypothetical protein TorRG33x02_178850 [Trema orientale]|uniref:Uncharacterized protein n=1 Tax=Trema orientale TaxID=63057 RepID=A0A2P5ELD4_TREOI|nr:hypothetical protein TorRG33x02_178850 [Trema orientale]
MAGESLGSSAVVVLGLGWRPEHQKRPRRVAALGGELWQRVPRQVAEKAIAGSSSCGKLAQGNDSTHRQ